MVNGVPRMTYVDASDLEAAYTPSNYTPSSVSGEAVEQISAHLKGIDNKLAALITTSFTDQLFTSSGVIESFQLSNAFDETTVLKVYYNGFYKLEGYDWERDVGNSSVDTIDDAGDPQARPANESIRIRAFSTGYTNVQDIFTGNGVTTLIPLSTPINAESNMDVYMNGIWLREDTDWQRVTGSDSIELLDSVASVRAARAGEVIVIDTSTGMNWIEEHFNLNGTQLNLGQDIEVSTRIDVIQNGYMLTENEDWTRDAASNRIDLIEAVNVNENITVKIWES